MFSGGKGAENRRAWDGREPRVKQLRRIEGLFVGQVWPGTPKYPKQQWRPSSGSGQDAGRVSGSAH